MNAIFQSCDNLNIQVSLYRSSGTYSGEQRWHCTLEGGDSDGSIKSEAVATAADAAVELAWHRFQRLASGKSPVAQAIGGQTPLELQP